jgi:hypothetical protein
MKTIIIYTVIPLTYSAEPALNDVKSFTSYEKASYYMHDVKYKFGYCHIDITESELEVPETL